MNPELMANGGMMGLVYLIIGLGIGIAGGLIAAMIVAKFCKK